MRVILPWPSPKLTPNAKRRTHWRVYQPVAKQGREDACYATMDAMTQGLRETRHHFSGDDPMDVQVFFYPPDRRRRDDDGMVGAFKHARDGIADALAVDDRRFRPNYHFCEPCKPGRVEVLLQQRRRV